MTETLVAKSQIGKAVEALKCYVEKCREKSSVQDLTALLEDEPVQLQLSFKLVPDIDRTNVNIQLKHSLVRPSSSVCLFVKDLEKSREFEKSVKRYEQIFSKYALIKQIEIVPLKKLKLEYGDFESRRRLSNQFDLYLADSRIIRLLPPLLGKHFIKRKRFPLQVRLDSKNLEQEFAKVLSTAQCVITGKGSTCQVTVGALGQDTQELVDNIDASLQKLTESRGPMSGAANVRGINIKTHKSKSIPLYLSLGSKGDVKLPAVKKAKRLRHINTDKLGKKDAKTDTKSKTSKQTKKERQSKFETGGEWEDVTTVVSGRVRVDKETVRVRAEDKQTVKL